MTGFFNSWLSPMSSPAELRRLLEQATPGPWKVDVAQNGAWLLTDEFGNTLAVFPDDPGTISGQSNLRAIVAAVNALPQLLDRLEKQEAVVELARIRATRGWLTDSEDDNLRRTLAALEEPDA
jgi:hypothetical protein